MKISYFNDRLLRGSAGLLLLAITATPAFARHKSEAWARAQYTRATSLREALTGMPVPDRSRREYDRAIGAFERVYLGSPTSSKADPSVVNSAELMVEKGRRFNDNKTLRSAIKRYEFLRREYPGSRYRAEALFTIAEIYKDDLHDGDKARSTFQQFLEKYPHSRLAEQAQNAIAAPDETASKGKVTTSEPAASASSSESEEKPKERAAKGGAKKKVESGDEKAARDEGQAKPEQKENSDADAAAASNDDEEPSGTKAAAHGATGRVTGIRHWSNPDYTRVAIDLDQDFDFHSVRISDPDRIVLDLPATHLASTLVGKTFEVADGLLEKIRVAQYQPGDSRIVLEMNGRSEYKAFALSNPPRLMIDIHSKGWAKQQSEPGAKPQLTVQAKGAKLEDEPETPSAKGAEKIVAAVTAREARKGTVKSSVNADGVKQTIVDDNADASDEASPPAKKSGSRGHTSVKVAEKPEVDEDSDGVETSATNERASTHEASGKKSADQKLLSSERDDIREASPRADGDRSLIRALGLKIGKIVIDPGHGGHDTGTIGPRGLEEKDLVLDVSRRLGKLLQTRLGSEVVYTRKDDTFIPLETRTAIANEKQADLFVSVHANSSRDRSASGVETYYLNFSSSPEAMEVAARENAISEKSVHELQDLVKKIALREKIEESHEFAADVEDALHSGLSARNPGVRNRGVKKAPFIVLIGANMPSILAEISFVSNPDDEHRLKTAEYRQRIAESLYRGIAKYVSGLSGVKVASRMEKVSRQ